MKLPADFDEVCKQATAVWGAASQEAVAIGEIGELLTLWGKRQQKRSTTEDWIDEISDCVIMIEQLARIHGIAAVEARIAEKIPKLKLRLAAAEEAKACAHVEIRAAEKELYVDAIKSCRTLSDEMMFSAEKHKLIARYGDSREKWNWHPPALRMLSLEHLKQMYTDLKGVE